MTTRPKVLSLVLAVVINGLPLTAQSIYVPGGSVGTSSNANIGIGTTAPSETLHVTGSIRAGGRSRVELDRTIAGNVGATTAIGAFNSDGTGKNIRIHLKAHNGSVIDVHTYEINEVAYIGQVTQWLEIPLNQNSVSYSGAAAYAVDVYRPNISSHTDSLYVRLRSKRLNGGGPVQLVIDYDDDVVFTQLTTSGATSVSFNSSSSPASGGVDGYYGALEWMFPVTNGHGWANANGNGLFIRNNGNVGIGTAAPGAKLEVAGDVYANGGSLVSNLHSPEGGNVRLYNNTKTGATTSNWTLWNMTGAYGNGLSFWRYYADGTNPGPAVWFGDNGNIGIGTTTPGQKLGVAVVDSDPSVSTANSIAAVGSSGKITALGANSTYGWLQSYNAPLFINSAGNDVIVNGAGSGRVGIGTTTPTHKLAVNGTVRAKEVIVDTGWADYVFDEGYRLTPLSEVEAHIREKKHLPDIPSASEVSVRGVSVGEMQARLLAKIEELTLHVIRQEKEIQMLKTRLVNPDQGELLP